MTPRQVFRKGHHFEAPFTQDMGFLCILGAVTTPMSPKRVRLNDSNLYLVCDSTPASGDLDGFLAEVLDAGVDIVQLREKGMEAGPLMRWCEMVRRRTDEFEALFIVNDRLDVALACGADGVHLGQDDLPLDDARRLGGPELLIGSSTHTPAEVDAAPGSEADYIGVGPVHATPTKEGRPAVGTDLVSYAAEALGDGLPFFAIGGINSETVGDVVAAGARRISVLRAIIQSSDPASVVRDLKKRISG